MERATIRELSEAVIGELKRLGYASGECVQTKLLSSDPGMSVPD